MSGDEPPTKPGSRSGAHRLNLAGVLCARGGCQHRRDEHLADERGVRHDCMKDGCSCATFVAGGMTEEELRAKTDPEFPATKGPDE